MTTRYSSLASSDGATGFPTVDFSSLGHGNEDSLSQYLLLQALAYDDSHGDSTASVLTSVLERQLEYLRTGKQFPSKSTRLAWKARGAQPYTPTATAASTPVMGANQREGIAASTAGSTAMPQLNYMQYESEGFHTAQSVPALSLPAFTPGGTATVRSRPSSSGGPRAGRTLPAGLARQQGASISHLAASMNMGLSQQIDTSTDLLAAEMLRNAKAASTISTLAAPDSPFLLTPVSRRRPATSAGESSRSLRKRAKSRDRLLQATTHSLASSQYSPLPGHQPQGAASSFRSKGPSGNSTYAGPPKQAHAQQRVASLVEEVRNSVILKRISTGSMMDASGGPGVLSTALSCAILDHVLEQYDPTEEIAQLLQVVRLGLYRAIYADFSDETIEGEPGNTREGSKQAQRNSAHDKANELKHHLIRKPWFSMVAELRNALQASEEENTQLKDNSLEAFKRRFVTWSVPDRMAAITELAEMMPDGTDLLYHLLRNMAGESQGDVLLQLLKRHPQGCRVAFDLIREADPEELRGSKHLLKGVIKKLQMVPDLVPSKRGVLFARIKAVTALSALARSRKRLLDYGVNTDTAFSVTMKSIQEGTAGADCSNIMQRLHDDDVTRAVAELGETHRLRYLKALLAATSSPEEERLKKEKEERQKEQDALLAGRSNVTGIGASVIKRQDSKENQVDDDEIQQVDKQQMASALLGSITQEKRLRVLDVLSHTSRTSNWMLMLPALNRVMQERIQAAVEAARAEWMKEMNRKEADKTGSLIDKEVQVDAPQLTHAPSMRLSLSSSTDWNRELLSAGSSASWMPWTETLGLPSLIKLRRPKCRRMTAANVNSLIARIYEAKVQADNVDRQNCQIPPTLPEFVVSYLIQFYGLKKIADTQLANLIYSMAHHRDTSPRIRVFAQLVGVNVNSGTKTATLKKAMVISTLDSTFLLDMVKALIRNDKAIDERMGSGDDDATVQLEVVERVGKAEFHSISSTPEYSTVMGAIKTHSEEFTAKRRESKPKARQGAAARSVAVDNDVAHIDVVLEKFMELWPLKRELLTKPGGIGQLLGIPFSLHFPIPSPEKIASLRSIFDAHDQNKDGVLSFEEFKQLVLAATPNAPERFLTVLFEESMQLSQQIIRMGNAPRPPQSNPRGASWGVSGMSSPTGSEGKEEFFHDDSDDEIGDEGELPLDIVAADLIYPDAFILALQRRGLLTDTDETSTGFEVKGRMSRRTTGNESGQNSLQQKNKERVKAKNHGIAEVRWLSSACSCDCLASMGLRYWITHHDVGTPRG